jgi:hypothetical protein
MQAGSLLVVSTAGKMLSSSTVSVSQAETNSYRVWKPRSYHAKKSEGMQHIFLLFKNNFLLWKEAYELPWTTEISVTLHSQHSQTSGMYGNLGVALRRGKTFSPRFTKIRIKKFRSYELL